MAHVALGDIPFRFAWQAWHLWHWAGSGVTHHLCHTPSSHTTLSPTIFDTPSFTHHLSHHFVTHHFLHPTFHTPSLTHHLSHTTLSRHTPLCITPSFTHHFVTHHLSSFTQLCCTPTLSHAPFHTQLSHTHTIFHIQLGHTQLCFTSRSSTTSFVFPSFPVPATTFGAHCWKKLPCGVFRSFNFFPSYSTDHQVACSVISQLYPNFWRFKSHNNTH